MDKQEHKKIAVLSSLAWIQEEEEKREQLKKEMENITIEEGQPRNRQERRQAKRDKRLNTRGKRKGR